MEIRIEEEESGETKEKEQENKSLFQDPQKPSMHAAYNENFILHNLEGFSAVHFAVRDE